MEITLSGNVSLKAPITQAFGNTKQELVVCKTQQKISHLHLKIFQFCFLHKILSGFPQNQLFVHFCLLLSSIFCSLSNYRLLVSEKVLPIFVVSKF